MNRSWLWGKNSFSFFPLDELKNAFGQSRWPWVADEHGKQPKIPLFSLSLRDMEQGRGCRRLNKRGRSLMPSSLLAAICSVIGSVEGPAVCARRASRRPPLLSWKKDATTTAAEGASHFFFSLPQLLHQHVVISTRIFYLFNLIILYLFLRRRGDSFCFVFLVKLLLLLWT